MTTIRSMTGFARVHRTIDGIDAIISVKGVNHRGLDLQFHMSSELDPFEAIIRSIVKRHVSRGHIDVRISLGRGADEESATVNRERLGQYIRAFRQAAREHNLMSEPDLNTALRIPGMLGDAVTLGLPETFAEQLSSAFEQAMITFNDFRSREGRELSALIVQRNAELQAAADKMEAYRGSALRYFHDRLRDRIGDLLAGAAIEPHRLAQEAAILADRGDIAEETTRLRIHSQQLAAILEEGGEIGKRIDFLLQEMNRETNTILSKTNGIGDIGLKITELGLAAKSDIEKIREQALNLE